MNDKLKHVVTIYPKQFHHDVYVHYPDHPDPENHSPLKVGLIFMPTIDDIWLDIQIPLSVNILQDIINAAKTLNE